MALPADSHVHSEWSWDTSEGSMERTCARAVELGLPAVAFTEHVDHTAWIVHDPTHNEHLRRMANADRILTPPELDLDGYFETLQRCRDTFPDLRIISGVELGEPHWHADEVAKLLKAGEFERVLGSQHCLPIGPHFSEPPYHYAHRPAEDVVRAYLDEIPRLVDNSDVFAVLAHIDYPMRSWPTKAAGPFDPTVFEEEFRVALLALADSGRALEVNTRGPLPATIVRWWHEEGGEAVTFGSDAHLPDLVGHGFADAAAMVEANGFRPGRHPYDFWVRSS